MSANEQSMGIKDGMGSVSPTLGPSVKAAPTPGGVTVPRGSYPYRQPCGCMATDESWMRLCTDHQREHDLMGRP